MFRAGARKVKNGQAAPAILPFSHSVSAEDLILTEIAMNSFRDFMEQISRLGQFSDLKPFRGLSRLKAVLWIRICLGSIFRSFPDPYSEYGSGSTHANIG